MSSAATQPIAPPDEAVHLGDHVVVLRDLRWSDWVRLTESKGHKRLPRMAYLDGVMELMSPSRHHERIKSYLGTLIETWCLEKGIDVVPLGSWTLESKDDEAGLEPDECYQLGEEERARPDVAIEVIWTSGSIDKLEIYRRLGVREVWFWHRGQMQIHLLRDEAYVQTDTSEAFPGIDPAQLVELCVEPTVSAAQRKLLAHLREA